MGDQFARSTGGRIMAVDSGTFQERPVLPGPEEYRRAQIAARDAGLQLDREKFEFQKKSAANDLRHRELHDAAFASEAKIREHAHQELLRTQTEAAELLPQVLALHPEDPAFSEKVRGLASQYRSGMRDPRIASVLSGPNGLESERKAVLEE